MRETSRSRSALRMGFVCLALGVVVLAGCSSQPEAFTPVPDAQLARANALHHTHDAGTPFGQRAGGAGMSATNRMPVDLPTVMRLASGRNLDVALVRQELREAHAEMVGAGWWPLPTIRPGVRFRHVDGNVQATKGEIENVDKDSAFVGGSLMFDWELGEAIFEQLAAKQRACASRHAVNAGISDATLEAAEAYFDLLRAQMAVGIADESLALYDRLAKETKAHADTGGGFRGDVLRARAKYSHAVVVQRRAQEEQRVAAARLREILNLASNVELYSSEGQPAKLGLIDENQSEDALVRMAMVGRPELREARLRSQAAKADRDKTTMGPYIPRVTAGVEGGAFGRNLGNLGGTSDAGVGLEWKVGRGGIGDSARSAAAAARERQSRIRIQQVQQQIVREVGSALAGAQTRAQAIEEAGKGTKEAEEALNLYRERQKLGLGIPLDAIVAEETFTQARLDYLDAVIGFNKSQVRLMRAVGRGP